jgi:hypothetical protein
MRERKPSVSVSIILSPEPVLFETSANPSLMDEYDIVTPAPPRPFTSRSTSLIVAVRANSKSSPFIEKRTLF